MSKTTSKKPSLPFGLTWEKLNQPEFQGENNGYLIDGPSPFAPIEQLRAFLTKLHGLNQNDIAVKMAISRTERGIKMWEEREARRKKAR